MTQSSHHSSLAVFIPTCDKYISLTELLLPKILAVLARNSGTIPIYVSTDSHPVNNNVFKMYNATPLVAGHVNTANLSWATQNLFNLRKVTEKYVLLWLDDLIPLQDTFIHLSLSELISYADACSADYLRIVSFFNKERHSSGPQRFIESLSSFLLAGNAPLYELPLQSPYSFSLIPSIWNRSTLINILESNTDKNAWQLEHSWNVPNNSQYRFHCVSRSVIGVSNLVVKGYLWPPAAAIHTVPVRTIRSFRFMPRIKTLVFHLNLLRHTLYLVFLYLPNLIFRRYL